MTLCNIVSLLNSAKVFNEGALNSPKHEYNLRPSLAFNDHYTYGLIIECDQLDGDGNNGDDDDGDDSDDDDDGDDEYNGEFDDDDDEPYGEVNFEYEPGTYWDYGDDDDDEE
ncbi:hypothetical protein BGZ93_000155 [Podila epicladia]|nr:hypothetical protein BGZ92_000807 [Podila epicladia]KAG0086377.1 hypothetical protein BGZ93_000155 [Podila epicladia]